MFTLKGLYIIISSIFAVFWEALRYPFYGGSCPKYKTNFMDSMFRAFLKKFLTIPAEDSSTICFRSINQLLNKTIKSTHPELVDKLPGYGKKFDKHSYWLIESKNREKNPNHPIIIYLHGGAYMRDLFTSQVYTMLSIHHFLEPSHKEKTSILILDYKLASRGYTVPTQLMQLTETYTNLANQGHTNIILFGDSAGGHLAITFTQHLRLDEKLSSLSFPKSTILISPWCKLEPDEKHNKPGHSYYDNGPMDIHDFKSISSFVPEFNRVSLFGDVNVNSLIVSPGNCEYKHSDWESIPTHTQPGYSCLVIAGEYEVFLDDILEWTKYALGSTLEKPSRNSEGEYNHEHHSFIRKDVSKAYVEVVIEPWGIHDSIMLFESKLLKLIKQNTDLKLSSVDADEFFCISKVVDFLNRILSDEIDI
ncbi:Esterase/lipase, putative [Candida maltosa Xu316]|uniref:Esterase/lipase, putative n=1 Tax=Candida maltosa (strain Xu316) TaxID=1245528 RepID=M3HKW4_CANMX|nr:Esterase/lipase, putative [Candida maltosa Xu316]